MVENAFGRLKGRGLFDEKNDCDIDFVIQMTITCCGLHNMYAAQVKIFKQDGTGHLPLNPCSKPTRVGQFKEQMLEMPSCNIFCHCNRDV